MYLFHSGLSILYAFNGRCLCVQFCYVHVLVSLVQVNLLPKLVEVCLYKGILFIYRILMSILLYLHKPHIIPQYMRITWLVMILE